MLFLPVLNVIFFSIFTAFSDISNTASIGS